MLRSLALAALLALPAAMSQADAPKDQLLAQVSRELPTYVPDVDASQLTRHQLASIYLIMHSGKSGGDKRSLIRSALGGRYALRSLFFK